MNTESLILRNRYKLINGQNVSMSACIQDLNSRAQAEVTIREALRELDLWGAAATFNFTEYTDSSKRNLTLIKDWKDIVNQVHTR